jgi:uncharacterized protein YgbK (DUF1537 family)
MSAEALEEALAAAPPSSPVAQDELAALVAGRGTVVILDDDPTGTQTVTGLPIVTRWGPDDLAWAFDRPGSGFCVLTNTRSLDTAAARARTVEVVEALDAAAAGRPYVVVSRGDSTLRGHHVDEIDAITSTLARVGWGEVDAVLVVPAFPDARRITVDSVHWVVDAGAYVPAGESSFARGYVREWTAERSGGRHPAGDVAAITLAAVRGRADALVDAILAVRGARHVVVDAADEHDLRRISVAAMRAEARGHRVLYRSSPGLLRARLGQEPHPALSRTDVAHAVARARPATRHGLVVVGSHVPLSTRQLEHLLAVDTSVEHVVIDVLALLDDAAGVVTDAVRRVGAALAHRDVVLSTSRARIDGVDGDDSLRIARTISRSLVEATRRILETARPSFLIGKGGITSSDLATGAVGLARATILGSLLSRMASVWQSDEADAASGRATPYAVFPGNVGSDDALAQAVEAFRAGANATG